MSLRDAAPTAADKGSRTGTAPDLTITEMHWTNDEALTLAPKTMTQRRTEWGQSLLLWPA